jgi:hypothetical protein
VAVIPANKFINATSECPTISEERKRLIMTDAHDHSTAGHPGRDETIRRAKKWDQWPGMNQWIANYVKGCATCQQNKILTHRKKTPLYRITTSERALPFQQIAMDLITGLPMHSGKNAILTIVDHGCSRAAIFLPCTTTICYARTSRIGVSSYSLYATHYRASGGVYSQLESRLGTFRQS